MSKTGQTVGQARDEAGQADVVHHPWSPRTDGKRALLVSERATVFDVKAAALQPEPIELTRLGPVPTDWTADLVHCRLRSVNAMVRCLPRVLMPGTYVSFLGALQPQEAATGRRRILTDDDTRLIDWTMTRLQLWSEIDRAVLMGFMMGVQVATISRVTLAIAARSDAKGLKRTAVYKRYRRNLTIMAEEWRSVRHPIDSATREAWLNSEAEI